MKIKNIGKTYKFDKNGYLIKKHIKSKIKRKWLKPINDTVNRLVKEFENKIHSIYLRGSVASGACVDNISDIDILVMSHYEDDNDIVMKPNRYKQFNIRYLNREITKKYPFVEKVDISTGVAANITPASIGFNFAIKHQCAHLFGQNLQKKIEPFKKDEIPIYNYQLNGFIQKCERWGGVPQNICKRMIRYAFESIFDEVNIYTRDLYPCYKTFTDIHPEKKDIMEIILKQAILPTTDNSNFKEIIEFSKWLNKKINK